jgi:hypothetical protein
MRITMHFGKGSTNTFHVRPETSPILDPRRTALKQYIRRVLLRASPLKLKYSIPTFNLTTPSTTTFIDPYEPELLDKVELLVPSASNTNLKVTWGDDEGALGLNDLEVVRDGNCIIIRERKFKREGSCHTG